MSVFLSPLLKNNWQGGSEGCRPPSSHRVKNKCITTIGPLHLRTPNHGLKTVIVKQYYHEPVLCIFLSTYKISCFPQITFYLCNSRARELFSHFTKERTEGQGDWVTCPKLQLVSGSAKICTFILEIQVLPQNHSLLSSFLMTQSNKAPFFPSHTLSITSI